MINKNKKYFSKLLLFGEYTVVRGSQALAIPYQALSGQWRFLDKNSIHTAKNSNRSLQKLLNYFKEKDFYHIEIYKLERDISNGLYFDSNIPLGYGLGSSGALVAAIYNEYAKEKSKNPEELKKEMAAMESFFHGSSSGLDPLVSYLNAPVLVRNDRTLDVLTPYSKKENIQLFLLDTNHSRQTEPLVKYFLNQCKDSEFIRMLEEELSPLNTLAIQQYLNNDAEGLLESFQKISALQLTHFKKMIPDYLFNIWKKGIEEKEFYLKLCGAGGGGMMLGITKNPNEIQEKIKGFNIQFI